jgi:nitronate monooxygenase
MWTDTAITRRLGIAAPIVLGPFGGGVSSVKLTAAVSNTGGLGSFGANGLDAAQIAALIADLRKATDKPFAINLWVNDQPVAIPDRETFARFQSFFAPYYRELEIEFPPQPVRFVPDYAAQIAAILDARPPVVSFVFGCPAKDVLEACRTRGIVTIGTATTPDEAHTLEAAGIDAVVATGAEAGGHRPSFLKSAEESLTGTLALIPRIVDAVKVPVIAAGGIADGRGIAAVLALGASAAQIGTAFLACDESGAPAIHRDALFKYTAADTALTRAFSGRLVRAIRNRLFDELEAHGPELAPFPIQNWLSGTLRAAAIEQARADLLSLQAGQAGAALRYRNAAFLMIALMRETEAALARLRG